MPVFAALPLLITAIAAPSSSNVVAQAPITIEASPVVATQALHYRKLYDAKPFPEATITYHANGVYRITSKGEDHLGVYVMKGSFDDETYTIRYISLPSADWGNRTAFHRLTFIRETTPAAGTFIQDVITDEGETPAQQNGRFSLSRP